MNILIASFNWFASFFLKSVGERQIMIVDYDLTTNEITCKNWLSEDILSGEYSKELWEKIKPMCRVQGYPKGTVIFIWAGMERKHLAYNEPIENYLNDPELLKTGQGFSWESKVRYGESSRLRCKSCGQTLPDPKN